jgi:adenylate cyclase
VPTAGHRLIISAYATLFIVCALLGTATGMQMYFLVAASLFVLFVGPNQFPIVLVVGALASVLIIALEISVPRTTGLQSDSTMFANFVGTAFGTSGMLLLIVLYALRQAARAEAAAEREYERSESLLINILPASIAERLKSRTGEVVADRYDDASILFADMAGFTARTSDTAPEELVLFSTAFSPT